MSANGYQYKDYSEYNMSLVEKIGYILVAAAFIFVVSYIFYRRIIFSLILMPIGFFYLPIRRKELIEKQKKKLNLQFKDMLYQLSSSLSAGKSIRNAFRDAHNELEHLYGDENADIIQELRIILSRLDTGDTVEESLLNFADRADLDSVRSFADVFVASYQKGGNMIRVLKNTSRMICDKIEIQEEINTILASKKFEKKVMTVMPVLLVFLLSQSSADYMEPLFNTVPGFIATTVAILMFGVAQFISSKILKIEV